MLHAVENSKTTRARQYAQPAKRDEHDEFHRKNNLQAEDEITSIVLGPMEFFNPEASLNFWLDLIGESNLGIKSEKTELVEFKLWAKRKSIEPDGLIVYKNGGRKYIFLLEVKWNADLSENQLENQWDYFLNNRERQNATHIFLGKDVKDAIQVRNDRIGKNDHKISVLSWQKFRHFLNRLPEGRYPREFVRWAKLAETFLEKCGVIDFGGFGQILHSHKELPPGFSCSSSSIFWHPFSGFSGYCINSDLAHQDSIFFNQGENNEWE